MGDISEDSLTRLTSAALCNAESLMHEAVTLLETKRYARAYFLAVASLEEIGKASIAFNASGRNLSDPKVAKRVRDNLLNHKMKITSAFAPSLQLTAKENLMEALEASMGLIGDLRRGREPSMYTEVLRDGSVREPADIVRPEAARDVVKLAQHCLVRAQKFILNNKPPKASEANDFFYALSTNKIQEIMGHERFADFYIERIKCGVPDLEEALYAFVTSDSA